MSKQKWVAVFLVIAFAVLIASVGFAATEQDRAKDLGPLQQQMLELRKEILKKHVEYGDITPERAAAMEKRMNERYEKLKANDFKPLHSKGKGSRHTGMKGCHNCQNTQGQQTETK